MNTRTRPARSTTATEIATLFLAQASIAPSAIANPSFQVMSRWVCTWALNEPGNVHAAIAAAVQPNLVHMIKVLPCLVFAHAKPLGGNRVTIDRENGCPIHHGLGSRLKRAQEGGTPDKGTPGPPGRTGSI